MFFCAKQRVKEAVVIVVTDSPVGLSRDFVIMQALEWFIVM